MTATRDTAPARRSSFLHRPAYQFGAAVLLGVVFGSIGPFGTFYDLAPPVRYGYWLIATIGGWAQIVLIGTLLEGRILPASRPLWLRSVISAAIGTVIISYEIPLLEAWFRPWNAGHLPPVWLLALYNLPLTVGISLVFCFVFARHHAKEQASAPPPALPAPVAAAPPSGPAIPFLRRVPARLGQCLLALEMEDHYLRIHTALGSDLVLCRLGDALAELEGCDGLQVHRSFWVARRAIAGHQRRNGRVTLTLTNGLEVPVSRTYLPVVRDAGWLTEAA
ncbi:MAG: LytTR family transcriptional regulator [Alphaproteobacteria bacterium]|jgi:hypothetical protein|nr:LytTR family transcriptional regulator [Alphaproteobacteria bacterium]